jgi:glycosyltransferase involved in cell wall biosynthesis
MRVLWLAHLLPFPPTGNGSLQRAHHLLKETARRHEIHLRALAPPSGLTSPADIDRAERELSTFVASIRVFPLPSRYRGLRRALGAAAACVRPISFWEAWYWSRPLHRHLRDLVRTTRFDVAHVETVFLAPYLTAMPGLPIVLSHHNVESQLLQRRAASQRVPWARAFFAREARKVSAVERTVAPRVAQNIVVSELDGARLRDVTGDARIASVANGVDVTFFQARQSAGAEPGTMIFAGGMDWFANRDGIEFFVSEIWPALLWDNPTRRMTVIGRNPPPALRSAARDPRLRVLGFVEDIRPYIEAASIYLCPVRVGGGTRLKILDALAMSRPLVSTDLGVEGLGLIEGEHYLRANTPVEFVSQVRRLESDAALRERLAAGGREFVVRHYSWHRVAESLEQAYSDAVRAPSNTNGMAPRAT